MKCILLVISILWPRYSGVTIEMLEYFLRRLVMVIPVVIGVSLIVFFMVHLIPGDPVVLMLGETAQTADIEQLRHDLGLDKPLPGQLIDYFQGILHGDLGRSLHTRKPVTDILIARFPATLELTLVSMFAALLIALPLGILSAVRANTIVDSSSMFFALLGVSLPNFWLGPMLILLLSIKLDWLPVSGRGDWTTYILPAITLGTALAAILTRMIRSSLLEVLKAQYVTTALAKGLSPRRAVLKHALRNALIPVVTILGLQFGALLGGSVITETIFSWPGIGREMIQAIQSRDYPIVQGCVLMISTSYVIINLLTDLVYGAIDPRIQFQNSQGGFRELVSHLFSQIRQFDSKKLRYLAGVFSGLGAIVLGVWGIQALLTGDNWVSALFHSRFILWSFKTILFVSPMFFLWIWFRRDRRSLMKLLRRPAAVTGLIFTLLFFFFGIFGPDLVPQDPVNQNLMMRLNSPDGDHLFGMDNLGRDLFSRVLYGTRISMYVGLLVTLVSAITGIIIGMISGLAGGWVDDLLMRIVDIMLAFPGILLAIAMVAVLGPNINNVILALCIMGWVGYARLARGQVLAAREEEYVVAARSLGAGPVRLMFHHLLPNIIAPLIVQATLGMAGVIIAEAGLSFLGLGVQPPTPSWGGILNSGVDFFREGPHMTIFPGLAIMSVVMGLNFLGDGLRDALDPKTRR